jgi:hypothetical protein
VDVIDAEPAKAGDVVFPLPIRETEEVLMVYVPAGNVAPLSVRASVVTVRLTLPVIAAE